MELNESTLNKIEALMEVTMDGLKNNLANKRIASGIQELGPRPKMQVAPSVAKARKAAIGRVIDNAHAPTVFHRGGKK